MRIIVLQNSFLFHFSQHSANKPLFCAHFFAFYVFSPLLPFLKKYGKTAALCLYKPCNIIPHIRGNATNCNYPPCAYIVFTNSLYPLKFQHCPTFHFFIYPGKTVINLWIMGINQRKTVTKTYTPQSLFRRFSIFISSLVSLSGLLSGWNAFDNVR